MQRIALTPMDHVTITTLMDNVSDALLPNEGPAHRFAADPTRKVAARFLEAGTISDAPTAEHGFSALITLTSDGHSRTVLFDAGMTPGGVAANMRRLAVSPKDIEAIVLSHGHFDHTTGLDGIADDLGQRNLPVLIHPEFWSKRRIVLPGREPRELPSTSKTALRGAGFEIIEEQQPSFLLDGSLLITGEVDRTTPFEQGFRGHEALRGAQWQPDPLILDDQAAILHVRDKGLVVLTGCGHAGIVNIARYAQRLTGVDRIYAVLGGFHLNGPMFEPIIPAVVEALTALAPELIVPAHCTGWRAVHALAAAFPNAFIQNSVGTRFELSSGA